MKRFVFVIFFLIAATTGFCQSRSLQYFVDQAFTNSPLLKDLRNQEKLNRLDSLLIVASQRVQVGFTSNELYAPVIKGYGYDNAITNGANVSALVGVNKSLLNGKNNKLQFTSLQLLTDAARNNAAITEQDLRKAIIDQYIVAYGDMLQVNASKVLQDMMERQDILLKKLTQKNVYKQVDYLSFFVTLQQNGFTLKQQSNQFRNDYAMLNYIAGITDTTQHTLDDPAMSVAALPEINKSAFFQKFLIDSLTLINSKALLDINYRPRLNVFADAGYNSSLAFQPYKNIGTSVGLTLVIPIYDGQQKALQYSKIDVQENTRQANKKFFTDQYNQQIIQLKQQLQSTSDLITDINTQLKYIETLITVNEKLLQTGEVRVYDYIMALTNYINAKNMINDNTISRLQIINQINYWNR